MAALIHLRGYWRAYLLNGVFVCLVLFTHTLAYGDEIRSGEFHLLDQAGERRAGLTATEVEIRVDGMLARVVVKQNFRNPAADWAEGRYVFPLPANSAVDYMAMVIGERRIVGKIREREQARAIYESAKRAGKKASLLSQQRPNLFTNRVANIPPGQSIRVELHYLQLLPYDQGRFSLRVPTTLTPRYIPGQILGANPEERPDTLQFEDETGWARPTDRVPDAPAITPPMVSSNKATKLRLRAVIKPGFPLDRLESLHHPARLSRQSSTHRLELQAGATLDRDVVIEWQPAVGQAPMAAALTEAMDGDHYALMMVMPPQELREDSVLPRETVFIVDTSGSMAGNSIEQAKSALLAGLQQLRPADRFNILEFNSRTRPLWRDAKAASPRHLSQAAAFVRGLYADGGTEMRPALELALRKKESPGYLRQVVFITDGSVGNEAELFRLISRECGDNRLFTVGIGSAPNGHFMEKAAEAGRGSFTYIGAQKNLERAMRDLFHKLRNPVMADIEVDFGSASPEFFPKQLPDLYAGEPLVFAARFRGSMPAHLLVRGRRNGEDYAQRLALPPAGGSKSIHKLWARKKLAALYQRERNAGASAPDSSVEDDIVQLAVHHQLMSKYTSFVAVEERPSRPAEARLRSHSIPNAMPAGNAMAIPLPAGALGLNVRWALALLCILGLVFVVWAGKKAEANGHV